MDSHQLDPVVLILLVGIVRIGQQSDILHVSLERGDTAVLSHFLGRLNLLVHELLDAVQQLGDIAQSRDPLDRQVRLQRR